MNTENLRQDVNKIAQTLVENHRFAVEEIKNYFEDDLDNFGNFIQSDPYIEQLYVNNHDFFQRLIDHKKHSQIELNNKISRLVLHLATKNGELVTQQLQVMIDWLKNTVFFTSKGEDNDIRHDQFFINYQKKQVKNWQFLFVLSMVLNLVLFGFFIFTK